MASMVDVLFVSRVICHKDTCLGSVGADNVLHKTDSGAHVAEDLIHDRASLGYRDSVRWQRF